MTTGEAWGLCKRCRRKHVPLGEKDGQKSGLCAECTALLFELHGFRIIQGGGNREARDGK